MFDLSEAQQQLLDSYICARVGYVHGGAVYSPVITEVEWSQGITTSQCPTCGTANPQRHCESARPGTLGCGNYMVFDNGIHEANNYMRGTDKVMFLCRAYGHWVRYEWGLRAGQAVIIGIVDYSPFGSIQESRKAGHTSPQVTAWRDSMLAAFDFFNPLIQGLEIYPFDTAMEIIRQAKQYYDARRVELKAYEAMLANDDLYKF